jgi:hypothetical protein
MPPNEEQELLSDLSALLSLAADDARFRLIRVARVFARAHNIKKHQISIHDLVWSFIRILLIMSSCLLRSATVIESSDVHQAHTHPPNRQPTTYCINYFTVFAGHMYSQFSSNGKSTNTNKSTTTV